MTIEAKIIADSISPQGIRLTTFQLRYPRFIHAEELTHRILETQPELIITEVIPDGLMYDQDLSRNASSSRAIPVERMIADLIRDPVMPIYWGSNKPGMQAGEELTGAALEQVKFEWLLARDSAIKHAQFMVSCGLHKQIANRILEPWAHINVVVTATSYENFFALRCHPDAQPEIKMLADLMREEMDYNVPCSLAPGEWHMPYIRQEDRDYVTEHTSWGNPHTADFLWIDYLKRISVARCARVSYLTHDGRQTTVEEDLALYERLVGSMPLHASPAEHQATPDRHASVTTSDGQNTTYIGAYEHPEQHGNLHGWIQFRKTLPGEFTLG